MNQAPGTPVRNDPQERLPVESPERRQLTAEEIDILKECGRESFWYRCVPMGLAGALATKFLIQKGILKTNPYYGSIPKITAAILVAYFAGKVSYQGACNEKFLRLENSPIADMIRQKYGMKRGGFSADLGGWDFGVSRQYDTEAPREQKLSEYYDTSSALDLDSTKEVQGLDDTYRPSIDNTLVQRKEEAAKEYISYDELRQKNRAAYERSLAQTPAAQRGPIRRVPLPARAQPPAPISSDAYSPSLSTTDPVARQPSAGARRNKYGDVIE